MKKQIFTLILMAIMMVPASSMAAKSMDHSGMDHSKMNQGEGMSMGGKTVMLKGDKVEGVTASAHLMDIKIKMAEHGMSMTHHFMVGFMNEAKKMESHGQVALKIESPDGKVSNPIKLMGMNGQFGADITLNQQGMYHFKVGTKFPDGTKRMFHMHYDNG
ncbi:MAG: hypothetical protein DRH06_07350 [Deltaproteobacteria bacterium]|nr:MAG: hypothetical protein DRH06_07350 [Deltaproteobacteria bacterium]